MIGKQIRRQHEQAMNVEAVSGILRKHFEEASLEFDTPGPQRILQFELTSPRGCLIIGHCPSAAVGTAQPPTFSSVSMATAGSLFTDTLYGTTVSVFAIFLCWRCAADACRPHTLNHAIRFLTRPTTRKRQ